MPLTNNKVTQAYIDLHFRPAVIEDFNVGLSWAWVRRENVPSASGNDFSITGRTIGDQIPLYGTMALVEELRDFLEGIGRGEVYIATNYTP